MVHKNKKELKGTNIIKYINWGEKKGFDKRPTCANRGERWYDIGKRIPGQCFWMMTISERYTTNFNSSNVYADARLYDIYCKDNAELVCGYLNSTLANFLIEILSRSYGGGGGPIDVKVYEVLILPIINLAKLSKNQEVKANKIFNEFSKRTISTIFSEIGANLPDEVSLDKVKPDRRELDKIIMGDILGLTDEEQLEVYRAIVDLVKSRLDKAKSFGKKGKTRDGVDMQKVLEELDTETDKD